MKSNSILNKIKSSMKFNIHQIILASILVGIGIIIDSYMRIGYFTFLTMVIYIFLGISLPLWLGIISATLIDTFSLLARGVIGYWYWALQLEPIIIIMFSFLFKFIITSKINEKKILALTTLVTFIMLLMATSIFAFIYQWDNFQLKQLVNKDGSIEKTENMIFRITQYYCALIGIIFILYILFIKIYKFKKDKNNKISILIFIIFISIIIDWIYHPLATSFWLSSQVLNTEWKPLLYKNYFSIGVIKSLIHIFISITVFSILIPAWQNTKTYNYQKNIWI